jgi:hypothetical protein
VLTNERHAALFSSSEQAAIRAHVPWTRVVRDGRTQHKEESIDLLEFTRANRDRLVLKPNDDYGGHGIYIGWATDEAGWNEAMQTALADGDYLVQERVPTAREVFQR